MLVVGAEPGKTTDFGEVGMGDWMRVPQNTGEGRDCQGKRHPFANQGWLQQVQPFMVGMAFAAGLVLVLCIQLSTVGVEFAKVAFPDDPSRGVPGAAAVFGRDAAAVFGRDAAYKAADTSVILMDKASNTVVTVMDKANKASIQIIRTIVAGILVAKFIDVLWKGGPRPPPSDDANPGAGVA
ncbi:hypothetical protein VaNZ11_001502 [Volvox africanus]|uniref:Uncharacterized protein n=1 Tax=Volvox africanus TaxID=51714 RepID=A0ABQ5RPT3_9CHLO|nr:hypothetical protein VaNZ11_001502 [Volvox africanus]